MNSLLRTLSGNRSASINSLRGKNHGALDDVLQFAHISRPVVIHQQLHRGGSETRGGLLFSFAEFPREMIYSSGISSCRSRSGGKRNGNHIQAMVKILSKTPFAH